MPRAAPFEAHHERYEAWFDRHEAAYISELLALRAIYDGFGLNPVLLLKTVPAMATG